jgi:thioredoxin 1
MIPLLTQLQLEALLVPKDNQDISVIIYFTASWCGACQRLDLNYLESIPANPPLTWYKCDVDVNKYSLGYCGLTKIPSFAFIKDGKFLGKFTSSDTGVVEGMIKESF